MAEFDPAKFRKQFPEFKDETKYPDEMLELYWETATTFMSAEDCPCSSLTGKQRQAALNMLTAHLLTLSQIQIKAAAMGVPGSGSTGFVQSSTVGEVSVSKLAPPASDGWQWWLASTPYGQMLWALLETIGVGGFAIGGLPERAAFRKVGGVFL